jgi:hypothetical protein
VGVNGRVILKWILKKYIEKMCPGLNWLRIGLNSGPYGENYDPSGFITENF